MYICFRLCNLLLWSIIVKGALLLRYTITLITHAFVNTLKFIHIQNESFIFKTSNAARNKTDQ
jgi:hypothetical protein